MKPTYERLFIIALALIEMGQGYCWTYITAANKTDGFGAQLQVR